MSWHRTGTVVESSIPAVLYEHAILRPDDLAFTFIDYQQDWAGIAESLTWSQLYRRVLNVARALEVSASTGDRALILAPQGLDYIAAFLGALQAGLIAVPLSVPLGGVSDERVNSVMRDASPSVILTTSTDVSTVADFVNSRCPASAPSIVEVDLPELDSSREFGARRENPTSTMYLQYTSGSTRQPAGVIISQGNILANFEQVVSDFLAEDREFTPSDATPVSWLPFYHDMGLLMGIVFPILAGASPVLMSPVSFLQRPARWLRLLASNGRVFSAAPNFAFELAARKTSDDDMAGLDLGDVLCILSGAERVQPATLRRFAERFARFNLHAKALRPSYGLAEATVYVATREAGQGPEIVRFESEKLTAGHAKRCVSGGGTPLVSYGVPQSPLVRIVDPETMTECPAGTVGEIWVHGGNVATGYWRKPHETATTFAGRLVAPSDRTPEKPWLRTGDLGFFSEGELFVVGRIKDLLIVYGRNHAPDDVEATVQEITRGRVAAISVPGERTEKLVVIFELKKASEVTDEEFMQELCVVKREVILAISNSHGLRVADLVPVVPGSIPITTSGKITRSACVEQYEQGRMARLDEAGQACDNAPPRILLTPDTGRPHANTAGAERLRAGLAGQTAEQQRQTLTTLVRTTTATVLAHPDPAALDTNLTFRELGIDSVTAVELSNALEQSTSLTLSPVVIFDQPTPAALARHLTALLTTTGTPAVPINRIVGRVDEPVAVVGMACRFPGGVDSAGDLWDLVNGRGEALGAFPDDRGWDLADLFDPDPDAVGTTYACAGAFLTEVAGFDAEFFGISSREAAAMDPQQRLLLEVCWEALETAGIDPAALAGSDAGVFVGAWSQPYGAGGSDALEGYALTGAATSVASGRVAYVLGLQGPAISVDTACSSSLVATHLACQSLRSGESSLALAGGVTVMTTPVMFTEFARQRGLAPDGRCKPFAADADGTGWGEGAGVLILERLSDAERNRHPVLAVIAGSAINQDGASNGLTAPNGLAQQRVICQAAANAGIGLDQVDVIEAHGTGTTLGDPIEAGALLGTYGAGRSADHPLWLGSIKSNIGHTQAAAGVAGMIKMIAALNHDILPPTLHAEHPSPHIDWSTGTLRLLTEEVPWPVTDHPRTGAVSSFGISGTNAHVILQEAPNTAARDDTPAESTMPRPLLFPLSSTSAEALRRTAGRLADWVQTHDDVGLPDLAYTLAGGRAHRPVRTAVMASSQPELIEALREIADGDTPYVPTVGQDDRGAVWVFSGQGSQWAAMGAQLLATEPVFAAVVAQAEPFIARESGFSVTDAMSSPQIVTGQDRIQPTLFTMHVALAATLKAYGVRPGAVVGHSFGEAAAAVVAGALSLEDGLRVVCRRSQLMSRIAGAGATAWVELPAPQVRSELIAGAVNNVVVAVVASPQATVIAGAAETVRDLLAAWHQRDVMAREVPADVAFHSPQVEPILDELTDVLAELCPMTPEVPYYSATLIDPREQPVCDAGYWADNLRYTVRFAAAVQAALEDGYRVFAELAPHPLLTHAVRQTAESLEIPVAALAGMRREQELPHGLRGLLADLHSAGCAVDFSVLYPSGRLVDAPLPAWTRQRLPVGSGDHSSRARGDCTVLVHPLLGQHVRLPEKPERHVWQGDVGTAVQPWLGDYQIHHEATLPGAVYCEMALAAGRAVLGEASEVRDVRFEQMLLLAAETPVFAVASAASTGILNFVVQAEQEGEHARQATAVLHPAEDEDQPPVRDMGALFAAHPRRMEGTELRQWFGKRGIWFGPAFSGLAGARIAAGAVGTVLAEVRLPSAIRSRQASYGIHPALLDACFQSVGAHPDVQTGDGPLLPLGVRRLRAYAPTRTASYCYTTVSGADGAGVEADLEVLDEQGMVLLVVQGLRLGTGDSENANRDRLLNERLLTIDWQQKELPEVAHAAPGAWLLISTSSTADVVGTYLTDALKLSGAECKSMSWPQHGDHLVDVERLRDHLGRGGFTGLVVLTGPKNGNPDEESALLGREYVQHLVRIARELPETSAEPPRLYVVTRNAQTVVPGDRANLEQAGLRGLMRAIASERPHLRASQIDIDDDTDVDELAQQLLGGSEEDETAWRGGRWYTARLAAAPLRPDERHATVVNHEHDAMRSQIRATGDLETLELVACERVPPGSGQIEVAVTASGVNFADVLVALGRYPGLGGLVPKLGTDFVGVVAAVGPEVTDHKVGDHVGGLSPNGCWATFITCDAGLAVTLPAELADERAAAVTTAHATAWYALHELARIAHGDRVLIHSATGAVGQAAIAVARAAGAELFATAGSEQRREWLRNNGIEQVYDSRSVEFADLIRRDTGGYGVDIVLNSLTGPAQRAGIELLASGGRFIELGKRDIYDDTRLGLFAFRRNLTFCGVDLGLLTLSHPQKVRELLKTVYRLTVDGVLPVPESTHYALADAATAIRVMSRAQHTGKLVLDIPHTGTGRAIVPPAQVRVFRNDGAYIVTGGLGGLGLFLAERIASAGGRVVLTSRSQPTPGGVETIERIRANGADVVVECGDIAEPDTAQRLVATATATGLPVRGVLHAAAVIEDATLTNITDELLERDWAPKVYGAWNLHTATAGQPLDWFCSFSSAAALVGSPGQGAYAAANSWLDAFTGWRLAQGLPAIAIAWGPWSEIGRATAFAEDIGAAITPDEGAFAFETLLRYDRGYAGYASISGTPWLTALAQRSPFAEAFNSTDQSQRGASAFLAELNSLPADEWPIRLRRLVSEQVGLILQRSVDPDYPLSEYGLDSLGNLELRTRITTETGIRISPMDITTIRALAEHLCDRLAQS